MVEPDPWDVIDKNQENIHNCVINSESNPSAFEDNFQPTIVNVTEHLPDSNEYIQSLERKLLKLKNTSNILDQLKARREHCIENLLVGNIENNTNEDEIHLDEDIETNRRRDILRYIQPEQAINLGELVTIINYDHLEQNKTNSTEQGNNENL